MLRLVFSTAPEGVDVADYDDWYEEHIRDVVSVPGFLRAAIYRAPEARSAPTL